MASKTISKSASSSKSRNGSDKKQNNGITARQQDAQQGLTRTGTQGAAGKNQQNHATGGAGNRQGSEGRQGSENRQGSAGRQDSRNRQDSATGKSQQASGKGQQSGSSQSNYKQGDSPLEKFFLNVLKDIYYAEKKITQSLPKMQEAATTDELKDAFEDHLHQTERHVKRLEKVFKTLGKEAEGKKCEAIEGIAREVDSIIEETEEGTLTRDAALIIAAQKVEHYEIATYGGLVQLAITMGLHDAADLLDKTLMEEEDTDSLLTEIAENDINLGAEHEGNHYSWDTENQQETENQEEDEDDEQTNEQLQGQAGESDEEGDDENETESEGSTDYKDIH